MGARPFGLRTFGRRPSCERKFDFIDTIIILPIPLKLNVTYPLMKNDTFRIEIEAGITKVIVVAYRLVIIMHVSYK